MLVDEKPLAARHVSLWNQRRDRGEGLKDLVKCFILQAEVSSAMS